MINQGRNPFTQVPLVQLAEQTVPAPLIHNLGGGFIYEGHVKTFGIAETDSEWHIRRIRIVGGVTITEYAGGSFEYAYRWVDRATLTYSR